MPPPDRSRRASRAGEKRAATPRNPRRDSRSTAGGESTRRTPKPRDGEFSDRRRTDNGRQEPAGRSRQPRRQDGEPKGRRGTPEGPRREDRRGESPSSRRDGFTTRRPRPEDPAASPARKWGGVARRGARALQEPADSRGPSASEVWREAVARAEAVDRGAWEPDETWIEDRPSEETRQAPAPRGPRDIAAGREGIPTPGGRRRKVPRPVLDELTASAGPARGQKLANRIADATYAYQKERYQDARRILKVLVDEAPTSPAVRELYGLVLYRTGQWAAAAKQLEAFRQQTGSFDQHPVLADCYRALHRYDDAELVWDELREASPSGDLVAEGRMVAAGSRADQGDLQGAITLLERSGRRVGRPQERHLRQWYALADLYERAGDMPRARELFRRIAATDPDAFDVGARLRALR